MFKLSLEKVLNTLTPSQFRKEPQLTHEELNERYGMLLMRPGLSKGRMSLDMGWLAYRRYK